MRSVTWAPDVSPSLAPRHRLIERAEPGSRRIGGHRGALSMSAASNRGFSLVELLVSMVLLGVVTGSVTSAALSAVRTADRSRERARQEGMLREVAAVVERELGDVAPARDIGGFAAESVTYRAGRGSGYTCGVEGGAVVVRDADYRAWRLPDAARDSLLVLLPGDSARRTGTWVVTPLLAAPDAGPLPRWGAGTPARRRSGAARAGPALTTSRCGSSNGCASACTRAAGRGGSGRGRSGRAT